MKRLLLLAISIAALGLAVVGSQEKTGPADTVAKIPPHLAVGGIQPRLSPDGETIAFSYQGAIWSMPRSGGAMTRLTDGEGFDMEPAWSPDGTRIALVRTPYQFTGDLKLIQAKDGADIPLPKPVQVKGTIVYQKIEFHPDGGKVMGVFASEGKDHGLAWYDLKTGNVQSIATLPRWSRFALSQDGNWIAYSETMDVYDQQTGNDGQQADLWKIPAEGGKPEKIVRFPCRVHDLCWSTDGGSLIVVSELGGAQYDLWNVPLSNSLNAMRKLTFGQADEDRPSVSRDGRWLLYTDNHRGATASVLRDLTTGQEKTPAIDKLDYRRPVGKLRLTTRDADAKKQVVTRIAVKQAPGKYHAPEGSLYRILRNYLHFYCEGEATWTLPAGKYQLRAFRGPEYTVAYREFEVQPGQTLELAVDVKRWTSQAKGGWFSGENHIHANYGYGQWYNTPRTMFEQCSGEDLNVCNFVVANSDTDGVFDRAFFRGGPDPLSTAEIILYWNQEFRSTLWGHMTLVNLKQVVEPVFTGFKDTTNPWDIPTNADVADRTHWQQGVVNYTHCVQNPDDPFQNPYAAKGLPIDVALGKTDTLDINNSYAGCVPVWYRLLNCGFRVPATAGTDCFLNRIFSRLPGGDRVYVKTAGPLNYADWIQGLKAGRSFVSNGPMLELTLDGKGLGEVIKLAEPRKLKVHARASAAFPLAKVEVVFNGQVMFTAPLEKDGRTASLETTLPIDKSGWLALRASGPGHPDSSTPALYAHTNPIYVEVAGAKPRSRDDALFFLRWIDQLELIVRTRDRLPNAELRRHVGNQLEAARAAYATMVKAQE